MTRSSPEQFPLKHSEHQHKTRFRHNLLIPQPKKTIFLKGPQYLAIKAYNHLPEHLKIEKDYRKFQGLLKSYLIEKCFYNVNEYFE